MVELSSLRPQIARSKRSWLRWIQSGNIASGAVSQFAIGSGAVGSGNTASGAIITYARNVVLEQYSAAENISGVRCVGFLLGGSGAIWVAMAAVSGRWPAIGVAFNNALSGSQCTVVRFGEVVGPLNAIGSGLCISGRMGRSLWMGASGQLVTVSGGGPTIGVRQATREPGSTHGHLHY